MLRRALLAAVAAALFWPAAAHAGVFAQVGPTIVYTADQGAVDDIAAFPTPTTIRFTRFGGGAIGPGQNCVFVDDNAVDCPKAGITSVVLNLGDGDDVASVAQDLTIPFIFNGGPGRDGLFGGGGLDVFDGGSDDDSIVSRETRPEQVDCGDGHDTAISDDADVRISCEEVEGDADGDGIRHPADCDDTNPAIHPGAVDIPGDGIDQDCSGLDAVITDRDHDGTPLPQDCNDEDASVHPGAAERIGNDVDENCDGLVAPFPPLTGSVQTKWTGVGTRTRNVELLARRFPTGTQITLRCTGSRACPRVIRRTVGRARRPVDLHPALARHAAAPLAGRGADHAPAARRPGPALPHGRPRAARRRVPLPPAGRDHRAVLAPLLFADGSLSL